ncbi:hypothetical protein WICMUC_000333 [Wickerhamomyces mucosus]|uniref:Alpha/beta hydrolase fold-3 domain-containing protein n=1 Tax=Wickerhamomyces mucosus TaxID=1378264 RepID=A0A9P8PXM1_9ASCO|nr:hypothetical protein WICMUC_000333 [Wickerhamomyces mucosus]
MIFFFSQSTYSQRATTFEFITTTFLKYNLKYLDYKTIGSVFLSEDVNKAFLYYRLYTQSFAELGDSEIKYVIDEKVGIKSLNIISPSRFIKYKNHDVILFYIHGGGFIAGSPWFYAEFMNILFCALTHQGFKNPAVIVLDYQTGNFANDLTNIADAWYYINSNNPTSNIILGGDGSGGLLAMSLLFHIVKSYSGIRPQKETLIKPCSMVLISPWTRMYYDKLGENDLRFSGSSDWIDDQFLNDASLAYLGEHQFNMIKRQITKSQHTLTKENQVHVSASIIGQFGDSKVAMGDLVDLEDKTVENGTVRKPIIDDQIMKTSHSHDTEFMDENKNSSCSSDTCNSNSCIKKIIDEDDEIDFYLNPLFCSDLSILERMLPEMGSLILWGDEEFLAGDIKQFTDNLKPFGRTKCENIMNQAHDFPILTIYCERIQELREDSLLYIIGSLSKMILWKTDTFLDPGTIIHIDRTYS